MNQTKSVQSQAPKSTVKSLGKGYMRGIILAMLAEQPRYGYEILHSMAEASEGWRPSPGTIYPILHDLYKRGYISKKEEDKDGRRRIIYKLRAKGKAHLENDALQHGRFVAIMRKILGNHGGPHFPGSPAFNVDKALQRLQHIDLLLNEAPLLPDEVASDSEHGIILLRRRLQLLENLATNIDGAIQNVKKQLLNLEKKVPASPS